MMEFPLLGTLSHDADYDWLVSAPVAVPALDGLECEFLLEGYEDDAHPEEFHEAVRRFLSAGPDMLRAAQQHIYYYYLDCAKLAKSEKRDCPEIQHAAQLWDHLEFGAEILVRRRSDAEQGVYLVLECDCDWNEEDGLQIVFREGNRVSRVSAFDDFLSNQEVYGIAELDSIVYQSPG
ncbi:DUF6985 domain-containing protein [Undibacterium squillarum]|uniref:DUF6985 domain-containing protein n=1 Tax=Undibacterium squillarum TaxID=1131567 RepID=A0ABQ2Y2Q5_9BURK|nr:hypothetical protein [Undibacterium squillarum]GGX47951.1 hypothetical protein GCM10010946_28080 [Undibacterium squillarum]